VSAPRAIKLNQVSGKRNAAKYAVASGPVPKRALNITCRITPNIFEAIEAIEKKKAPSVMLKRRSVKLEPRRKLEGLKRNVLPPQCLRRMEGPPSVVVLVVVAVDSSTVATATVVFVSGTAESCVIALSPQNKR
jgi:hypothetical protein